MQIEKGSIQITKPKELSFTADQILYLNTRLPKGFIITPSTKPPKETKSIPVKDKNTKPNNFEDEQESASKNIKDFEKANTSLRKQRTKASINSEKQEKVVPKKIKVTQQMVAPELRPCWRILQTLKKHPSSWPFLEPVDPIALGIPTYFEIIKEPMDFSTIQRNLGTGVYETQTQFHADVGKVFINSCRFNSVDSQVHLLSKQVQQFYEKLIDSPDLPVPQRSRVVIQPVRSFEVPKKPPVKRQPQYDVSQSNLKKKKPVAPVHFNTMTIAEKKQLGQNIRRLPRDSLKGVWEIVNDGNIAPQELKFDIDKLHIDKARELQRYVNLQLQLSFKTPFNPKQSIQTSQTYRQKDLQSQDASSFMVSEDSN